jgi:hypothetical protein
VLNEKDYPALVQGLRFAFIVGTEEKELATLLAAA